MTKCPTCEKEPVRTCQCEKKDSVCPDGHKWHHCVMHGAVVEAAADHTQSHGRCSCETKDPQPIKKDGTMQGFMMLDPSPDTCHECGRAHDCRQAHDNQSLIFQYRFYSKRGRWPTWKDALAHCTPDMQKEWEEELRKLGRWTEPESEAPDVLPTEDQTIGSVTTITIKHPKRKTRKKK
jgi:hypothetical protein